MIELCQQHNTVKSLPMFRKLFSLLVLSGLFFSHSVGGGRLGEYNWAGAICQFLVDALDKNKEKMRTTKNLHINGF